jgi:uncharacterized membrane protein YfcA
MIVLVAISLLASVLIGCTGIGGVLLVPCLTLAGVDVHKAIGASMFSFIFSGVIGVWLYARHGSTEWSPPRGWQRAPRREPFLAPSSAPI